MSNVPAQPGDLVGERYLVKSKLAEGGMGELYLAEDRQADSRLAVLKFPKPEYLFRPGFRQRFAREASALTHFSHPGVVTVYSVGEHQGTPYMALQYLSGGTLDDRIRAQNRLPPAEVAAWLSQVADALDSLHAEGIIHRDIKAGNLLFDKRGKPFISDFGIIKTLVELERQGGQSGYDSTGGVLGSIETLAPEYVKKDYLSPYYDQYGLATTVYKALAGKLPFEGETADEMRSRIALTDPRPLIDAAPHVGAAVSAVVMKALSRTPTERYRHCSGFAEAFAQALRTLPGEPATAMVVLQVHANVQGARISLDGQPAGHVPGRLQRAVGRYHLKVEQDGYLPHEEILDLRDSRILQLRLEPAGSSGKPRPGWVRPALAAGTVLVALLFGMWSLDRSGATEAVPGKSSDPVAIVQAATTQTPAAPTKPPETDAKPAEISVPPREQPAAEGADTEAPPPASTPQRIFFEFDKSSLTAGAKAALDKLAQGLRQAPELRLELQGHSDQGGAAFALALSERLANSVRAYLVSKGVDAGKITTSGFGNTKPLGDPKTLEGRAQNRRVDIIPAPAPSAPAAKASATCPNPLDILGCIDFEREQEERVSSKAAAEEARKKKTAAVQKQALQLATAVANELARDSRLSGATFRPEFSATFETGIIYIDNVAPGSPAYQLLDSPWGMLRTIDEIAVDSDRTSFFEKTFPEGVVSLRGRRVKLRGITTGGGQVWKTLEP